jgi:hypothetical protein
MDSYFHPQINAYSVWTQLIELVPFFGAQFPKNVDLNRLNNVRKGNDCRSLFKCLINWSCLFSLQIPEPDLLMAGGALE